MTLELLDTSAPVPERDRFAELARSPYFDEVVAANRLYLTAAVADPLGTERTRWALSCLPATGGDARFSTVSMSGMETFAVFRPHPGGALEAQVFASVRVLESFRFQDHDGLRTVRSHYVCAGDDQIAVVGHWPALARALADRPLRTAARALAERLMLARTRYSRFHDDRLASRVLGRF